MGLRTRLWLVIGALALVPLVVGGLVALVLVDRAGESRVRDVLATQARAGSAALVAECRQVGLAARSLGAAAVAGEPAQAADSLVGAPYADYAALFGPGNQVLVTAGELPSGARPRTLPLCSSEAPGLAPGAAPDATGDRPPVVAERVAIAGPPGGPTAALVALTIDRDLLERIAPAGLESTVTVLAAGELLASTAQPAVAAALAAGPDGQADVADLLSETSTSAGTPFRVVVAGPAPDLGGLRLAFLGVVGLVAALALLLGWHLSRQLTRPLEELIGAAERVAGGRFDAVLPVNGPPETRRLASAFNGMTRELGSSMTALAGSRDELRRSIDRLSGALGSTHDLKQLLPVVLDAAAMLSGAATGAAWATEGGGPLKLMTVRGVGPDRPTRLKPGTDLWGRALGQRQLQRADGAVAVPLRRGERVVGLLALEAAREGPPLDPAGDEALLSLAAQAGIAVDNILLHQETQRQSITDPLTGLWNFRYLSRQLSREVERAERFHHVLAVLLLDIDYFKRVNDTHGHPAGDAVLRELAARVREQIREVDTLARYGGEEFVLVLPETDLAGAGVVAERVCTAVRRQPFALPGGTALPVTVSVGVASYPQHGETAALLVQAADGALYEAKNGGRNQWRTAQPVRSAPG